MPLPDFLGIGVQRAGTTFVHEVLRDHPGICTPENKEVHFFDQHWEKGRSWYETRFEGCATSQVVGEITPDYIADPRALRRIAKTVPDAKLFVILRDPVERAYSAYWLFKRERYRDVPFEEAVEEDAELIRRGYYADQLEDLLELFERGKVKICFLADLKEDNAAFIRGLYEFLGVDPSFEPETAGESHNAVIFPRFQGALDRVGLLWLKEMAKAIGLDEPVRRWHRRRGESSYPPMDPETKTRLRDQYNPHDERLQEMLDRTLPWPSEEKNGSSN